MSGSVKGALSKRGRCSVTFYLACLGIKNCVLLCLYLADPAIFLTPNSTLVTLFSSENSLFTQLWKQIIYLSLYYIIDTSLIL